MFTTVILVSRIGIACVLACGAFGACMVVRAQERSCATLDSIPDWSANPFTAQRVTHSVNELPDGTEQNSELIEFVARDGSGRVRVERRPLLRDARGAEKVTLNTRDGGTIHTTRETLGTVIVISDCPNGKTITIQPGMQIARVMATSSKSGASAVSPQYRPYSSFFNSLAGKALPPTMAFEDMGSREFEGIAARGFKTTHLGSDTDNEWKGKAVLVREVWVSDDLAAVVMETGTDWKEKRKSTTILMNIKREEPDSSLFEIPAGYKINPSTAEMPYQTEQKKRVEQKP